MSIFTQVQNTKVKSNTFDLTHDVKLSTKWGQLTPVCVMETIPGDRIRIAGNALVRLAPMIAPVMHRANVYIHYFFVPNRLLWDNWENFITGGEDGNDASVHPYSNYNISTAAVGTLADYLGVPTQDDCPSANYAMPLNTLPFAAYQKIYNDYYRDQNFIDPVTDKCTDGDNVFATTGLNTLRQRAWRHDYLTSALPWTQRGPEVLLPLGDTAPIIPVEDGNGDVWQFFRERGGSHDPDTNWYNGGSPVDTGHLTDVTGELGTFLPKPSGYTSSPSYIAIEDSHEVDLTAATSTTIIELRRAVRLQEWLEKNARGGARYIESLQVHFGVRSSDKRLQRAEYVGGFSAPIKFSEVLQTSQSEVAGTPQGTMAGHGVSVGGSKDYTYYCEEHGFFLGILSCLPDTAYQNGLPRMFFRNNKFDYPFPSFAHIGEQPIYKGEVFMPDTTDEVQEHWGYTPRYAPYKFMPNRVAGDFRSTLDFWHMGRKFSALPNLNQSFIEMTGDEVSRIFAVQDDTDTLWIQALNVLKVSRKLPLFDQPYI